MAVLCIMDRDNTHRVDEHDRDKRHSFKRGDIVSAAEGFLVYRPPAPPFRYVIVDAPLEAVAQYAEEEVEENGANPRAYKRHFHFMENKIPHAKRDEWNTQGVVSMTLEQLRKAVRSKKTGNYEG